MMTRKEVATLKQQSEAALKSVRDTLERIVEETDRRLAKLQERLEHSPPRRRSHPSLPVVR